MQITIRVAAAWRCWSTYRDGLWVTTSWPDAFEDLVGELRSSRRRPALIGGSSSRDADELVQRLAPLVDDVVSLGGRVARMDRAPSAQALVDVLTAPTTLLTDIDVLLTPALRIDVLSQLRRTAQVTALIVAWPGEIQGGRLSYSRPGRADYLDEPARDLVVLRPAGTQFPDEVPYTVERFPA